MKTLQLRDTYDFRRGREFEQHFARLMINRGWAVIRCYAIDADNTAPMLDGPFKGLRLPDLQIFPKANPYFVECKLKKASTYTYSKHIYEQGIGLRAYRDYCAVQRQSGIKVFLAIAEHDDKVILVQSLDRLGQPREYHGKKMDPGGMAFWHRDQFVLWGRYDWDKADQPILPYGPLVDMRAPA